MRYQKMATAMLRAAISACTRQFCGVLNARVLQPEPRIVFDFSGSQWDVTVRIHLCKRSPVTLRRLPGTKCLTQKSASPVPGCFSSENGTLYKSQNPEFQPLHCILQGFAD